MAQLEAVEHQALLVLKDRLAHQVRRDLQETRALQGQQDRQARRDHLARQARRDQLVAQEHLEHPVLLGQVELMDLLVALVLLGLLELLELPEMLEHQGSQEQPDSQEPVDCQEQPEHRAPLELRDRPVLAVLQVPQGLQDLLGPAVPMGVVGLQVQRAHQESLVRLGRMDNQDHRVLQEHPEGQERLGLAEHLVG
jgi:hypothetical protein